MRFTSYSRYTGNMADALNLQALLDQLSDFLLNSGFAGGHHVNPWWGEFGGDEDDRSLDALKEALLKALLESGQLTPEMISSPATTSSRFPSTTCWTSSSSGWWRRATST
jgi:Ca-activated chloride channel family protein